MTESTVIDLGSLCVHCRKDTAFGHPDQVFVNRIPADTCEGVGKPTYKGYMCGDCLAEADQEFDEEQKELIGGNLTHIRNVLLRVMDDQSLTVPYTDIESAIEAINEVIDARENGYD